MSVAVHPRKVVVPLPGGEDVVVDPREHRSEVIARLLALGVAPRTLAALLPEWSALIEAAVAAGPAPATVDPAPASDPAPDPAAARGTVDA